MANELANAPFLEWTTSDPTLELFHNRDRTAFADLWVNAHRETWAIQTKEFSVCLQCQSFERLKRPLKPGELRELKSSLEAHALRSGPERQVFVRVANLGEKSRLRSLKVLRRLRNFEPSK